MSSSISSVIPPKPVLLFDEHKWVIQIRKTLEEELEEETEFPVSIFNVPNNLMVYDPCSYVPQQVPIGPYHYWRPEMYEMERYKLAAAKRMKKLCIEDLSFQDVVHDLIRYEPRIRASYHKYLTCSGETLAWMMVVDACFILEFLKIYAIRERKMLHRISSRMSHLVDIAGRKSGHNAILRDMVMLENQIPLFILKKMLEYQCSSLDTADNMLFSMLMGFSKELYPFITIEESPDLEVISERAHLLDFLYHLMDNKSVRPSEITEYEENIEGKEEEESSRGSCHVKQLVNEVWKILTKLTIFKKILFSKMFVFLKKLPWKIITNLPGIKMVKGPIESFFTSSQTKEDEKPESNHDLININGDKPPLMEELEIPSVTELSKACIIFAPTNGGITSIKFDAKKSTFYLPSISLDENTQVTLKNLVAYEACNANGPVFLTRYTELMNGIIDTEEDAKILRESGIILNRLKSDEEVVNLWNGMNRCIRLTKAPLLDKVIEDVNKYYNGIWRVKVKNLMKTYIFGSWQFLTFLACIMVLCLMSLEAFCSVFSCHDYFKLKNSDLVNGGHV